MARTGASNPPVLNTDAPEPDPLDLEHGKRGKEKEHDYMADAPAERPYSEAISDEHRAHLESEGVIIP